MSLEIVRPDGLAKPSGYSHAVAASGQRTLYIAGQIAQDASGKIVEQGNIVGQFERALGNFATVLTSAGARPDQVVKMNIFVTRLADYHQHLKPIGSIYRNSFGRHFPAMTLVEVQRLFDDGAMIEIEGIAVLP